MPERRSAVMIMADAWWEALNGSLQKARVRIVNKSASGACIRSKGVIEAGAKLRIQSRWESSVAWRSIAEVTSIATSFPVSAWAALVTTSATRARNRVPDRNSTRRWRANSPRQQSQIGTSLNSMKILGSSGNKNVVLAPKVSYRKSTRRGREIS
jgi:hypothetical protein